jgi:hypothetical protein
MYMICTATLLVLCLIPLFSPTRHLLELVQGRLRRLAQKAKKIKFGEVPPETAIPKQTMASL